MTFESKSGSESTRSRTAIQAVVLLAILMLSAYLRFAQLTTNPGWYSDEGTLADIARHLNQGRVQYQALTGSTLLVARFPVVPFVVAALLPPAGNSLEMLRIVTASLGVLSTALVYVLVRVAAKDGRAGLALLAAALFAVFPPAVFYARVGFSYNLLAPLVLVAAIGLWRFLITGGSFGLLIAGLAVGMGSITDLMMVSVLIAAALAIAFVDWRRLAWWLPLAWAPLGLYLISIAARDLELLATDAGFLLSLMSAVPWWAQLSLIALNLGALLLTEVWWIPGIIGLLMLRPPQLRALLLSMFLIPLVLLGRTTGLAGLRLYTISPLFPFVPIGVACLLWVGTPKLLAGGRAALERQLARMGWLRRWDAGGWISMRVQVIGSAALAFLLVITPILVSSLQLLAEVDQGFRRPETWAYVPARSAGAAVDWVNARVASDELVISSPAISWALQSQTADFQQVLAYAGIATIDYPADLPTSRFAYVASLDRAAYAVVDPVWRQWGAVHISEVGEMLDRIESWPIVWRDSAVTVYENPAR